jgi:hypothetical protein
VTSKRHRDLGRSVEAAGLHLLELDHSGGTHLRVRARAPSGVERTFFCSLTPSSQNTPRKELAEFKRFARQNSVPEVTNMTAATPAKSYSRKGQKLITVTELLKLTNLAKDHDWTGVHTLTDAQRVLTALSDRSVPYTRVQAILEAANVKLTPKPVVAPKSKSAQRIVASELLRLMRSLNFEASAELVELAGESA